MTGDDAQSELRWFGRRRGKKLRAGRQALVDNLLPGLRIVAEATISTEDLYGFFRHPVDDVWLEIGFGAGEHLAGQAGCHENIGFIGCEPFINGVAALLSQIDNGGLTNIRVFDDDARPLLDVLPEAGLGRIFLLYSDPWPKKRHHRRRFVSPENLTRIARLLKDGGEFSFATDHMGYASWSLEQVLRHPDFLWRPQGRRDWMEPPSDWIETRYERKAKMGGARPVYFHFLRRHRTS